MMVTACYHKIRAFKTMRICRSPWSNQGQVAEKSQHKTYCNITCRLCQLKPSGVGNTCLLVALAASSRKRNRADYSYSTTAAHGELNPMPSTPEGVKHVKPALAGPLLLVAASALPARVGPWRAMKERSTSPQGVPLC